MKVRLAMSLEEAQRLGDRLIAERGFPAAAMLRDFVWLQAVLLEQRKRTDRVERAAFDRRSDRILGRLWADLETCRSVRRGAYRERP